MNVRKNSVGGVDRDLPQRRSDSQRIAMVLGLPMRLFQANMLLL